MPVLVGMDHPRHYRSIQKPLYVTQAAVRHDYQVAVVPLPWNFLVAGIRPAKIGIDQGVARDGARCISPKNGLRISYLGKDAYRVTVLVQTVGKMHHRAVAAAAALNPPLNDANPAHCSITL
jgi:hypothetical protein